MDNLISVGGVDCAQATIRLYPRNPRASNGVLNSRPLYGHGNTVETKAFLELVECLPLAGKHVADIGSGTGILAIRAAQRGALVTTYEDDPQAYAATAANAALNGVHLEMRGSFPDTWDGERYDIALANLGRDVPTSRVADTVYVTREEGGGAELLTNTAFRTRRIVGSIDALEDAPILRGVEDGRPLAITPHPPEDGVPTVSSMGEALIFLRGRRHPGVTNAEWAQWERMSGKIAAVARGLLRNHPSERDALLYLVQRGNLGKMANRDRLLPLEERMMTPWHMITINRATFTCNCEHDQAYRDFTEFAPIYHVRGLTLCEQHWKVGPQTAWELIHEHGDIQSEITRLHPETRFWTEGERLVIAPAATEYDIVAAEASLIFAGQHYEVR